MKKIIFVKYISEVIFLKDSLINSITKITDYIKAFIAETETDLKFEGKKSELLKVMYNSLLEQKISERDELTAVLNMIKKEQRNLSEHISKLTGENKSMEKKIKALSTFQDFLLSNR